MEWSREGGGGHTCTVCEGHNADTEHQPVPGRERDERRLRAKDGREEEEEHCVTNKTYSSGVEREREREKRWKTKKALKSFQMQIRIVSRILYHLKYTAYYTIFL